MCGRYYIDEKESEIRGIIDEAVKNIGKPDIKTGEIFPTNKAPVLLFDGNKMKPTVMDWGFPNFRSSGVIINARAETALEKRTFKESLLSRRCAIPTSGFYEWKKIDGSKNKDKYLFTLPKSNILYLAGFYNGYKTDGKDANKFVILTTAANQSMEDIHDRMPVILTKENVKDWATSSDYALDILQVIPPSLDKLIV